MIAHAAVKDRICAAQPVHRPTLLDPACTSANTPQGLIQDLQQHWTFTNLARSRILSVFQLRGLWLQSVCIYCNLPRTSWTLPICSVPFAPCNPPNSQAQVPLPPWTEEHLDQSHLSSSWMWCSSAKIYLENQLSPLRVKLSYIGALIVFLLYIGRNSYNTTFHRHLHAICYIHITP
jgi:hypothetical protein